jgi:hypothetical protein
LYGNQLKPDDMEAKDSSFNKVGKQIYSFIDREMSITLEFWIAVFLIVSILDILGFIH